MKKWLIGSLVGAIIVFVWQFMSWAVIELHLGEAKYTPAQDSVLSFLSSNLKEDGMYMLPTVAPGSSMDEGQKLGEAMNGKPWAIVTYKTSYKNDMVMPMIRGYLVDVVLIMLLIYVLTGGGTPGGMRIFLGSVAVGLITFLVGPYTTHNWFQTPTESYMGHLIDAVVAWALAGIWLGWWLKRK